MVQISQLARHSGVPAMPLRFYGDAGTTAGRGHGPGTAYMAWMPSSACRLPLEEIGALLSIWEAGDCEGVKADWAHGLPPV